MSPAARKNLVALSDPILAELILAGEDAREEVLGLLMERATAICSRVLQRLFGRDWLLRDEDAAEVHSLLALRLIRRLHALPQDEHQAIRHFDDYVAILTNNAAYDVLRLRFPERARLKSRVRYLLSTEIRFALWSVDGYTVCGWKRWEGQRPMAGDVARVEEIVGQLALDPDRLHDALLAIFRETRSPIRLGALVHALAIRLELTDHPIEPRELEEVAGGALLQDAALEQRQHVERLWKEIQLLPPRQRSALFFNLRDENGNNALQLFLLMGLTTMESLASLVGLSLDQFTALWDELPVGDKRISDLLGITRQQVINLRKSARERLSRRMKS